MNAAAAEAEAEASAHRYALVQKKMLLHDVARDLAVCLRERAVSLYAGQYTLLLPGWLGWIVGVDRRWLYLFVSAQLLFKK